MFTTRRQRVLATAAGFAMLAGAGTTGVALAATFAATLSGDHEVSGGDRDGWGRASIRIDDSLNTLCVDLEVRSIGQVQSVAVYRGRAGQSGDPVVNLDTPGGDNDANDCDTIGDTLADEIQRNPADFYVQVRTDEFPNGAIRGQLGPSGD
jgi:CHRD domain